MGVYYLITTQTVRFNNNGFLQTPSNFIKFDSFMEK